jgi:hypothetical protein
MATQGNTIPSTREIAELGEAIYQRQWEEKLLKDSVGKFVAINVATGAAILGNTSEEALRLAQEQDPQAYFHLMRVGHRGAFQAGWYLSHAR